jgi:hypothetical protein
LAPALLTGPSLVVIYGEPGSGKTFWVLDLCLHVADGRQWCDRAVEQGAVIYLAPEGGAGIRIAAARERMTAATTRSCSTKSSALCCRETGDCDPRPWNHLRLQLAGVHESGPAD